MWPFSSRSKAAGVETSGAEPLRDDFLGNPGVPADQAAQRIAENPAYRNGFLPIGISIRLIFALSAIVAAESILIVVLLVRENTRVQVGPQVFMQTELGKLVPIPTVNADATVPRLEAFLDFVVANAAAVRDGRLTNVNLVKGLIDPRALAEITTPLMNASAKLQEEHASISASIIRVDTSSPERFVLNRRYKRSYGVAYGQTLAVTGNGGGKVRDTRWDFEVVLVPQTKDNTWGFFCVQLKERPLNFPLPTIPPELRRPEDLMSMNP